MQHISTNKGKEAGFTLVELAIVMIIIGLLIGGILKGQELIKNAQVASTVAGIKGLSAGVNTFRDQYQGLPGDFAQAVTRLPNCTDCGVGNGNNQIGAAPPDANAGGGIENMWVWEHLNAADLVSGVDGTTAANWGVGLPAAPVGGGHNIGFFGGGALGEAANARGGHYITLQGDPAAVGTAAISASAASRIDRKMDDGAATTGSVFSAFAGDCTVAGGAGGGGDVYDEANDPFACELFVRM